jgi:hypothetical protein
VISAPAEDKQPPAKNARKRMQVRILCPSWSTAGGQGRGSGALEVVRQSGGRLIAPRVGDQLAVRGVQQVPGDGSTGSMHQTQLRGLKG